MQAFRMLRGAQCTLDGLYRPEVVKSKRLNVLGLSKLHRENSQLHHIAGRDVPTSVKRVFALARHIHTYKGNLNQSASVA